MEKDLVHVIVDVEEKVEGKLENKVLEVHDGELEPENNNGYFGELELIVDGETEGEKEILPNFDGEYYAQQTWKYTKIGANHTWEYTKIAANATYTYG